MFKLKMEKVVEQGMPKYKILGWEGGIEEDKLPFQYLKEGKRFIPRSNRIEIYGYDFKQVPTLEVYISWNGGKYVRINKDQTYEPEVIDQVIKMLKECGQRLHEIRQEVKKLEQEWQGEVEVII